MTDVELDSNFLIEERADYIDEDTIKIILSELESFSILYIMLLYPQASNL
ncbi:hypothetical protein BANRA_03010 [Escherichia coli]|nr:hypothetical protein BANRA_03010 [Escherichia coli]VCW55938.1 hypothetical protein BANRA_03444 [Escherichia coli]